MLEMLACECFSEAFCFKAFDLKLAFVVWIILFRLKLVASAGYTG